MQSNNYEKNLILALGKHILLLNFKKIENNDRLLNQQIFKEIRAVARTLIGGGGGVYSYILVLPD